ncbi:unnamed protein product [Symbiodinium sp. KB8]|nr:unnamed protein product [Symbiodinium sp. KB8]
MEQQAFLPAMDNMPKGPTKPMASPAQLATWSRYRTLCCGGGGTRGIAFIGVLETLEYLFGAHAAAPMNWQKHLSTYAGTSFGAIIALACTLGMWSADMRAALETLEKKDFFRPGLKSFTLTLGMDNGRGIRQFLTSLMREAQLPDVCCAPQVLGLPVPSAWRQAKDQGTLTFGQLYAWTGKTLCVTVTSVQYASVDHWSHATTPDLEVLTGVYASMCLPLLYEAPEVSALPGQPPSVYFDGGLEMNFPILQYPPGTALGVFLESEEADDMPAERTTNSRLHCLARLGFMAGQAFSGNQLLLLPPAYYPHILPVTTHGVGSLTMFHKPHLADLMPGLVEDGVISAMAWYLRGQRLQLARGLAYMTALWAHYVLGPSPATDDYAVRKTLIPWEYLQDAIRHIPRDVALIDCEWDGYKETQPSTLAMLKINRSNQLPRM